MSVRINPDTIEIDGRKIDLSVFYALLNTNNRVLWQFIEIEGKIQAISYDENQVIWIDRRD